eukprot:3745026-Rhodomonas_salina.1
MQRVTRTGRSRHGSPLPRYSFEWSRDQLQGHVNVTSHAMVTSQQRAVTSQAHVVTGGHGRWYLHRDQTLARAAHPGSSIPIGQYRTWHRKGIAAYTRCQYRTPHGACVGAYPRAVPEMA